ncbi:MAG TPA: hypothetical protein PL085_06275 [Agriterribacter sp.]|uniref:hypothetical protein n=1 Tax=Agriterribacter sp. TaxID=2821509 RepID=UPI002C6AAADC|nr:hypothetical protein [Agriterribacter sp.]HRQ16658.1 hypothetical protein [Agriterribacter sp.]
MNRKLPYEKLIAEKLQHLPLPGEEMSWQQMKAKLDREMPLSEKDGKGGSGKWWLGGLIVMLSVGIWVIIHTTAGDNEIVAPGNTELLPSASANTIDHSIASQQTPDRADKKNIDEIAGAVVNNNTTIHNNNPTKSIGGNPFPSISHKHTFKNKVGIDAGSKQNSEPGRVAQLNTVPATKENPQNTPLITEHTVEPGNELPASVFITDEKSNIAEKLFVIAGYNAVHTENSAYSNRKNITESAGSNKTGILIVPAYVSTLPDVSAKRKALLREMKRQERKEEKELSRSYRTYHSFWGETSDRWFAAGIAPYQNIAIASQQTYNYNSATGKNIITDYIPSPYLQLHVTNRIYLLSEFQFNTPQATPSLLLSHKELAVPSGNAGYTENIYLRKLYYFNMPVSFYYSPVKNFYLGSGLQFSSFNSGLADREQRSSNNTLLRSETIKLKDDSLSSKINGSEWRYLFDANYYYDRFMFGFRYNQALNNFVDLRVNNILPPTQARNQAFQLYIRYNLVVSDRKK